MKVIEGIKFLIQIIAIAIFAWLLIVVVLRLIMFLYYLTDVGVNYFG
jgi:hypothetical protein